MRTVHGGKSYFVGGVFGAGLAVVVVSAVALFAGAGVAASEASPVNTSPPRIEGTAQVGNTLVGHDGKWSNNPTSFSYRWERCTAHCNTVIPGQTGKTHTVTAADVGYRLRFVVKATNADGSTYAFSDATSVVPKVSAPANTSPPTVSGTPQEGKPLTGYPGVWTNGPSRFVYSWQRCDNNGGACATITGATATTYTLTAADVGHTLRFAVRGTNSAGTASATSAPTAVIQSAAPLTPPRGAGCASGNGKPDQVAAINPPARLNVDRLVNVPKLVTSTTAELVIRFHVTSTCGGDVQGALVYATATPFNQWTIPPEATTGPDGWAELHFGRLSGFPLTRRQQLIAMFARARKPGEPTLSGISTRRLFSVPVHLHS
jgi:hypothetical protein